MIALIPCHSHISDGSLTIPDLVGYAKRIGIKALAVAFDLLLTGGSDFHGSPIRWAAAAPPGSGWKGFMSGKTTRIGAMFKPKLM